MNDCSCVYITTSLPVCQEEIAKKQRHIFRVKECVSAFSASYQKKALRARRSAAMMIIVVQAAGSPADIAGDMPSAVLVFSRMRGGSEHNVRRGTRPDRQPCCGQKRLLQSSEPEAFRNA